MTDIPPRLSPRQALILNHMIRNDELLVVASTPGKVDAWIAGYPNHIHDQTVDSLIRKGLVRRVRSDFSSTYYECTADAISRLGENNAA